MRTQRAVQTLISAMLGSCVFVSSDFDKAAYVGSINLRDRNLYSHDVNLSPGRASLIVAIPGYECAKPKPDAVLKLSASGKQVSGFSTTIALHDLTWSYANQSCNAVGYLPSGGALTAVVTDGGDRVTVTAQVERVDVPYSGELLLWFIYGDRVPGARVFEPKGK